MAKRKLTFTEVAEWFATQAGRPVAFILALSIIGIWLVTGPLFGFSDTWQLIINTGTTIITFLMVFLIQNSQNRDTRAIHIKLDELLRATQGAHVALLDLEKLSDQELDKVRKDYQRLAAEARKALRKGRADTNVPKVRGGRVTS
jgi:low affinity Fe/Cu permease